MDRVSHELANRLVGNQSNAATLEMTLSGDELEWTFDAVIAITGADMSPIATLRGEAIQEANTVQCRRIAQSVFLAERRSDSKRLGEAVGAIWPLQEDSTSPVF